MTATTRTRPLTNRQASVLHRLTELSGTTYYSQGGWVPGTVRALSGQAGALRQLVDRGLVETTTARGPLNNVRPVYRPRAVA